MKHIFYTHTKHRVSFANSNIYKTPTIHPTRRLNEHDLVYLTEGEWEIGQENEIFHVKKDCVLILAGNRSHFGVRPCAPETRTLFVHASVENGDGCTTMDFYLPNDNQIILDSFIDCSGHDSVKRCFLDIIEAKSKGNDQKASACFDLLLCELAEVMAENGSAHTIAYRIKKIIDSCESAIIKNSEIAELLHISTKTAENAFKAYYNTTIRQYILSRKAEKGRFYLQHFPNMKMSEIALNLGFCDEYHFSRQFKKSTGMSPTEYRQQLFSSDQVSCPR